MSNFIQLPNCSGCTSWSDALMSPVADESITAALQFFQSQLGDSWRGWREARPLARTFFTRFQDGPPEGARLAHLARSILHSPHARQLLRSQVGSSQWNDYMSGVMTLELCDQIARPAESVRLVPTGNAPSPDIEIKPADRWLTIELKAMHAEDKRAPWAELVGNVVLEAMHHQIDLSGIRADLDGRALKDPAGVLSAVLSVAKNGVAVSNDLGTFSIDSGRPGFALPFAQADDASRILNLLQKRWHKKFRSPSVPTCLVVRTGSLFQAPDKRSILASALHVTASITPVLYELPNIGALVIYEESFWPPLTPDSVDAGQFALSLGATATNHARIDLTIPNLKATTSLRELELAAITRAVPARALRDAMPQ